MDSKEEMKTYDYVSLLKELIDHGKPINIHDKEVKELIDVKLIVDDHNLFYCDLIRPLEKVLHYFMGELIWYLSGEKSIDYISNYSAFWKNLVDDNQEVNSNYGYLVFYKKILPRRFFSFKKEKSYTGFEWCVEQLAHDIYTRQAVILYNDRDYYYEGNKDFICTQSQQFLVRDNELTSIVYIRSSDIIFGLTYDIIWWSFVQQQIRNALNLKYKIGVTLGKLIVNIGSSHIYLNKVNYSEKMLKRKMKKFSLQFNSGVVPLNKTIEWYENNLKYYINYSPEVEKIFDYISREKKFANA